MIERDYSADVLTINEICAQYGVARSTIYYYARTRGWTLRCASSGAGRRRHAKAKLTERLLTALDLKMSQFEKRMNDDAASDSAADSERDARTLNTLVRLFEKLTAIDAESNVSGKKRVGSKLQNADPTPKDLHDTDRIRSELARRLDELRGQIGG